MHSRRWYWLQSPAHQHLAAVRPAGRRRRQNAGVNYGERYGNGFRGILPSGTPVIVDNNISTNLGAGTNQDEIYFPAQIESTSGRTRTPRCSSAPSSPAKKLGIDLVVYAYFAYTFGRLHARPEGLRHRPGRADLLEPRREPVMGEELKAVDELTVDELKTELGALNQSVSGNKAQLQGRLTQARAAVAAAGVEPQSGSATAHNGPSLLEPADDGSDDDEDGPHVDPNSIEIDPNASQADPAPAGVAVAAPKRRGPIRDEANMKNPPPDVTAPKVAPPVITETENMVRGLLIERAGYERAGNKDRIAEVNEQLKQYGYTGGPKGRRSAPKQDA
jgi:hypothetical protein